MTNALERKLFAFRLLLISVLSFLFIGLPTIAAANTIQGITITKESEGLVVNTPIEILINFKSPSEQVACGLGINWGDGEVQRLRIGVDQQVKPPFQIQHTYLYGVIKCGTLPTSSYI